ncbi:MAG: fluoride efflux transporter CrcB [Desulfovibrio sp.]|nr:fluoride efflux transporter CrcB [Desulfovibrio sp.]
MFEGLLVGLGCFFGGILRYLIATAIRTSMSFPCATFCANLLGCLFLGVIAAISPRLLDERFALFLTTGFCGGLTTFSTFSKESLELLQAGDYVSFLFYTLSSLAAGILAVFLGFHIGK